MKAFVRFRFVTFPLRRFILYVYALMIYDGVLYFADEDAWDGIAILFVQLHVNKYAPTRAGFISYDCVVLYIIDNVCSFEWNE